MPEVGAVMGFSFLSDRGVESTATPGAITAAWTARNRWACSNTSAATPSWAWSRG